MKSVHLLAGAAATTLLLPLSATAQAAPDDYRFELVQAQPIGSGKTIVDIALLRTRDATPLTTAKLVRSSARIEHSGDARSAVKATPIASGRPGVYRFQVDTNQSGPWVLELSATVPHGSRVERTFIPTAKYWYTRTLPGNAELVRGAVPFHGSPYSATR